MVVLSSPRDPVPEILGSATSTHDAHGPLSEIDWLDAAGTTSKAPGPLSEIDWLDAAANAHKALGPPPGLAL